MTDGPKDQLLNNELVYLVNPAFRIRVRLVSGIESGTLGLIVQLPGRDISNPKSFAYGVRIRCRCVGIGALVVLIVGRLSRSNMEQEANFRFVILLKVP